MTQHGGRIHDHHAPDKILDYSANINPYGPPKEALKAASRALFEGSRHYPDPDQRLLRTGLSEWLGFPDDHFAAGNGAGDLILRTLLALKPQRVLSVHPTFSEYADHARLLDIPYVSLPLETDKGFAYPVEALVAAIAPGDLVIVCQPNNPTGRPWERVELEALLDACRSGGATLMVDECFINLSWPEIPSLAANPWPGNFIALRAFTKDFSAPGLRVGYLIASPGTASKVRETGQPWSLNVPGEAFAIWCCREGKRFLTQTRERLARQREKLTAGLADLGFNVSPGAANFLLARSPLPGKVLQEGLLPRGILVRRCDNFPGLDDNFIRVAVRTGSENDRLLAALARTLDKEV